VVDCQISAGGREALRVLPTFVALYWGADQIVAVGPRDADHRQQGAQALWVAGDRREVTQNHTGLGEHGTALHFRIVVASRDVTAFASGDGVRYRPVVSLERLPGRFSGAPELLILGRGGNGEGSERQPDLDNDHRHRKRRDLYTYTFSGLRVSNDRPRPPTPTRSAACASRTTGRGRPPRRRPATRSTTPGSRRSRRSRAHGCRFAGGSWDLWGSPSATGRTAEWRSGTARGLMTEEATRGSPIPSKRRRSAGRSISTRPL
jgi:hypothetical protein